MSFNTLNTRVAQRSDTAANWTTNNPVLLKGEMGIEIGTRKIKIGDGVNTWTQLSYATARPEDLVGLGYGDMLETKYATIDPTNGWVDKAKSATAAITASSANMATQAYEIIVDHPLGGQTVLIGELDVSSSDPNTKRLIVTGTDAQVELKAWDANLSAKTNLTLNNAVIVDPLGNTEVKTIKKTGGTSSQFLKADGSVDSKVYIEASGAPVQSVAGKTGVVTLVKADVGLGNVDNTADTAKVVASAAKLTTPRAINGVDFDGTAAITIYDATKVATSLLGANNGVATLGSDGKVPSGQLPSFVDDILEFANLAAFPATGEQGKIYVALDTNRTYRWSGSAYVEIANTLDYASQLEVETGTENTKVTTSLRVAQAITKQAVKSVKVSGNATELKDATGNVVIPAYPTTLPPNGSAGGDLTGTYPNPTIGANKVTTNTINALAVTDAKIAALEATKLFLTSGNYLILNCGNSSSTF